LRAATARPPNAGAADSDRHQTAARYADIWNAEWFCGPDVVPALRKDVDAACAEVGRDPDTLERTLGILVDAPGTVSRAGGSFSQDMRLGDPPPASGRAEVLADLLRAFAAEGISHVQIWLEPNTVAGIHAFAPVLEMLDRS
jgi:alkanesulfonate monooxygenase SsuD/methylene tetrahydromethanopterin reductase-like flavin-dependent oxidoreductase (luciferase family)